MNQIDELFVIAKRLTKTERGRDAAEKLLDWLDNGGLSLDGQSKQDCIVLLKAAFGEFSGSTRDAMRSALSRCAHA